MTVRGATIWSPISGWIPQVLPVSYLISVHRSIKQSTIKQECDPTAQKIGGIIEK
jgi:hypothetical protein